MSASSSHHGRIQNSYNQDRFNRLAVQCFFWVVCALIGFQTTAMASSITILTTNSEGPISTLTIGDDLYVGLANATPGVYYDAYLKNEIGETVAATTMRADDLGQAGPLMLWERSGVQGCGINAFTDFIHSFDRFEDAETVLDGRTFNIEVNESGSLVTEASTLLPMVDADKMRFYFANCNQCPIFEHIAIHELYVGAANFDPNIQELRIFVVDHSLGSNTLTDVRPAYGPSQVISNPTDPLDTVVWPDPSFLPELRIVVRASENGPTDPTPTLLNGDHQSTLGLASISNCSERDDDFGDPNSCPAC